MATFQEHLATALADQYRVDEEVGRGGMATVYLAHDLRPAQQRPVAIKVLHPDLRTALAAERFLLEIRVAANLAHPHIVPLHDSGDREGFLYYVMPYFEGGTLRHRLTRDYQLPVEEAVRIACDVAAALEFAHGKGVVHRDIKPENILIDRRGRVKIADFGLAKLLGHTPGDVSLTGTQQVMGTLRYMAPEQMEGTKAVDHRADIFSLGVVFYQMATGERPFRAPNWVALLQQILYSPTPSPKTLRPQLPEAVESIVFRATAKNREERYQSMLELSSDLRSLRALPESTTVGAEQPSLPSPSKISRLFNRRTASVAALMVLAAVLCATVFRERLTDWVASWMLPAQRQLPYLVIASPKP